MGYYDDAKNAAKYINMAEGYDGAELITVLRQHVPDGASVLELGMGPGKDVLLLSQHYTVTGSDSALPFIERFQRANPNADVLQLDAVTIDTPRTFDAIYSNKVLYHLTRDDLKTSFKTQLERLNAGGVALHSLWVGEGDDKMHGLHFSYYTEETLRSAIPSQFEVIEIARYAEMEPDDSLYVVLKKRDSAVS